MSAILAKLRPWHIALVFAAMFATLSFYKHARTDLFTNSVLHLAELKLLDAKFTQRGRIDVEPSVIIAAGDEKTIDEFGLWGTWDRGRFARIIKNLKDAGADVVAFDLVFADEIGIDANFSQQLSSQLEAGRISAELRTAIAAAKGAEDLGPLIDKVESLEQTIDAGLAGHRELAAAFDEHSSFVAQGYMAFPNPEPGDDAHLRAAEEYEGYLSGFAYQEYGFGWQTVEYEGGQEGMEQLVAQLDVHEGGKASDLSRVTEIRGGFVVPRPEFIEMAEYAGFFNALPDPDGTMRSLPLVARFGESFLPSLTLTAASQHFGANPLLFADPAVPEGLHSIGFAAEGGKTVMVPVDHAGRLQINYYGPAAPWDPNVPKEERGIFRRISLADIEANSFDKEAVKGQVVIVAVTAIGTFDQRVIWTTEGIVSFIKIRIP